MSVLLVFAFFITPLLQPLRVAGAAGDIIWKYPTGSAIKSSPAIGFDPSASSAQEGIAIYFGTDDSNGSLYALKPGTGVAEIDRVKWKKTTGLRFGYSSPTIGFDGTVYVATASLYAFAPADGALRGQFQFPNGASAALNSSPAIGTNREVLIGSSDGRFYSLKHANNAFTVNWSIKLGPNQNNPDTIASSPSVTADGTIYLVTDYDHLVALKPDGAKKWDRDLGGVYQPGEIASSPAIGRDGSIYIGSRNARLSALIDNGTDSSILWQYVAPSPDPNFPPWFVSSPIAGFEGLIYAGASDGYIYSLKPSGTNVTLKFRKELKLNPTRGGFLRSTAAIDNLGTVWIGSVDGVLYGVDYSSGDLKYGPSTGGQINSSPVLAIDVDGKPVVYVGSSDGSLYALRGEADLGSRVGAPWPMYRKDASHSGFGSANPPFISQQPASQTVQAGNPVVFTVVAGGNPAPTYQWRRNGTPITGNPSALTATLTLAAASPGDNTAVFDVVVSNSQGSLQSSPATLTVSNKPDIVANSPTFMMLEDTTSAPIPFTVSDQETLADQLVVGGSSSDTRVVPNANLFFGGSGVNRTVAIKPAPNQNGVVTITLFVRDSDSLQNSATFTLTITPVNDPPTLDPINDVNLSEGGAGTTVTVTGITPGQGNELGQTMSLTAVSDNPGVVVNRINYVSPTSTGTITLVPLPGFNGVAHITVSVVDTGGRANAGIDTFTRTFNASVTAINDPPTISVPGPQSIIEDTAQTILGVQLGDPDAGNGQIRLVISATNGIIGFGLPGGVTFSNGVSQGSTVAMTGTLVNMNKLLESLAYSANKEYSGPDTISFAVDDQGNTGLGGSKTATASIPITVIPVNDPPRIVGIPPEVTIKSAISFVDFTLEDPDSPLASIILSASSSRPDIVPNANLSFSAPLGLSVPTRRLRIDPGVNLSQDGFDITIFANDGSPQNGIGTAGFRLRILANNAAPVLQNLTTIVSIPEDSSRTLTFTVGDAETPAASLGVTAISSNSALLPNLPANLTLSQDTSGGNRTLVITPAANQFGTADIVVTVTDGTSPISKTIKLTVDSVPDSPVLGNIPDVTVFTTTGTSTNVAFTVFDGDTATGAEVLNFTLESSDLSVVNPGPFVFFSGADTNRIVRITPASPIKFGTTTLKLTVTDSTGLSDSKSFQFTVRNPSPVIVTHPSSQTVAIGGTATFTVVAAGPGPLSYQWSNAAGPIAGATSAILTLTGVQTGQIGQYFVHVSNAFGTADSIPAQLNVLALPSITTQPASRLTNVNATVSFSVVAGGGQPLAYQWRKDGVPLGGATDATLVLPNVQLSQEGRYSVVVSNPVGSVTSAEAILDVEANTPPSISNIQNQSTIENTPLAGISFSISDGETLPFALTVTAASTNLDLVPVANIVIPPANGPFRTLTITPAPGKFGTTVITITVSDGSLTASTKFTLTVIKANTPPTISDIKDLSLAEGSSTNVLFNVGDAETAISSLVVSATSSNPALVPVTGLGASGTSNFRILRITPATGQSGTATIIVKVSDGSLETLDSFVLTVIKASTPPTISDIKDLTLAEGSSTNFLFSVSDAETAISNLVVSATSSNPTLVPADGLVLSGSSSFRTLRLTPAAGQSGTATITVKVNDGTLEAADTFVLTVQRANTPPTISNILDLVTPESTATNVTFTVGDAETPVNSLLVTASSSNPALVPQAGLGVSGSGAFRVLTITPAAGQSGTANIVVKVNDGTLEANDQFTLTVPKANTPPVFVSQPRGQSVNEGDTVTFTADVTGTAPLVYQWRFNGAALAAATNATLVLTNVQVTQGGKYTVVVSNVVGSATSAEAVLAVTPVNKLPTVSIATPANGAKFGAPANVNIGAIAADSDGLVTKVEFFVNGTKAGEDTSSPFNFLAERLTPGNYVLTAKATDNAGGVATSAPVNITVILSDNLPVLRIEEWAVTEGGDGELTPMTFTVRLSKASAETVTVDYATVDDSAVAGSDYVGVTNRLVFLPNELSKVITVNVTGDSLSDAPNETFFVNLSNPVNANIAVNQAVGTITDDDLGISIGITDAAVTHGFSGTTNMVFEVSLSGPNGQPVTVSYATEDGTAKAGVDYLAKAGVVTFPPGIVKQTITVTVLGAGTEEANQTFRIKLSNPSNADLGDDTGTGTITRVIVRPTITLADVSSQEGNFGLSVFNFTVNLSAPAGQVVTVVYETVDGTAKANEDYTPVAGTLTFQPGVTSQSFDVSVVGDLVNEPDENFLIRLSKPTGGALLGQTQAKATILNDDAAPSINPTDASRVEGNSGSTNMTFTLRLNSASGQAVKVDYSTADGTATAGTDYVAAKGTVEFAPGVTVQTIDVRVLGDSISEPNETLFLNLTNVVNATLTREQARGTIIDDDPKPAITINDASVAEGNSGTTNLVFTVTLSAPGGQEIAVDFTTGDGTATAGVDYAPASGRLTFPPGVVSRTIIVAVSGDLVNEPDETLLVNLANPVNATLARAQAAGTIVNDDSVPTISIADLEVAEVNFGTTPAVFTVTLSAPSSLPVTVDYASADGTASVGADYLAAGGAVTFPPGITAQTISVEVTGDLVSEADETFLVRLSNPVNATIARGQATATIRDDDQLPAINITDASRIEGNSGTTNMVFTVRLNAASSRAVTVDYQTTDGTAIAGEDYVAAKGTLTFPAGVTTLTIPVAVIGDLVDEPNEVFFLNLTNVVNATFTRAQGRGTIIDEDNTPSLSIADASVSEGNSGVTEMAFNVSLSLASGQEVAVDYATADGSATAGSDYTVAAGRLVFPPGITSRTIVVAVKGDTVNEANETLLVNLSNPTNATLSRAQATGTINNDDVANSPPVLAKINEIHLAKDSTLLVRFTIADDDTPLNQLVLTASSGNTALLTNPSLTIVNGAEGERFIRIAPRAGQTGIAVVTLTLSDGVNTVSEDFQVTVSAPDSPPVIVSQPQARTVLAGTTVELSVGVTGSDPLSYQWSRNGTNLAGATAATLTLRNVQPSDSGKYRVAVTNPAGQALSNEAAVLVGQLGSKLWDVTVGDTIRSSPAIGPDGTIYVGSDDHKFYAVSPLGVIKWSYKAGAEIYSSPAVGPDGTIYFGARDFKLYALGPDGVKKWEYLTGNAVDSSPAIAADGTIYVGSYDNKLHAVRPDGTKKWEFAVGGVIYSSPAIGNDGTIYFGSDDKKLYALTPAGAKKWEFVTGAEVVSSPAIGGDGTIYVGSLDKQLYAVTPGGAQRWAFNAGNAVRSSAAIAPDGTIYFGADDGRLFALNSAGARMWAFTTGLLVLSAPAVGADGTVYVTSFDQRVYALNPNGTKRWEYVTEGPISSSPVLDADGVVYFGGFDKKLYAIKGTTGLADSAWPVFRRDIAHTGRAPGGAVSPPDITDLTLLGNGQVQLSVSVQPGKTYAIQFSTDLAVWTDLSVFTATAGTQNFTDSATGKAFRFYRVVTR